MIRSSFLFILFAVALPAVWGDFTPRAHYGALLEPPDRVIHGAGQSEEISFANYVAAVGPERHPAMYNAYTGADKSAAEMRAKVGAWAEMLSRYPPGVAFQLGLSMKGDERAIADGRHDAGLRALAEALHELDRPVFVRIGYEANGPWNKYSPKTYTPAFRHVADILHEASDRIAVVWCIIPIRADRIPAFYPGLGSYDEPVADDPYIDWWSIDLFEPKFINPANKANYAKTVDFLERAHAAGYPVMIGESTPQGVETGKGKESWDRWFAHFFRLIRDYPGIKAFIYINRNWEASWLPDWGEARIEVDPVVRERIRRELDSPLYLHAPMEGTAPVSVVTASGGTYTVDGAKADAPDGSGEPWPILVSRGSKPGETRLGVLRFDLSAYESIDQVTLNLYASADSAERTTIEVYVTRSATPVALAAADPAAASEHARSMEIKGGEKAAW
ncbi:MAG: hypothetical protein ACLFTU_10745, partial [Puniceicoccaceae bacterium]